MSCSMQSMKLASTSRLSGKATSSGSWYAPLQRRTRAPRRIIVSTSAALRLIGMSHRLAEQVERSGEVAAAHVAQRRDGIVDRFARDEPGCQLAREAVPPNEPKDAGLLAQPQEGRAQHQ